MDANADEYEHDVPDVMYVACNIPGPGIDLDEFESEYSVGCSCTARCDSDRCSCTRATPNYIDGLIVDKEKPSGPIMECNSRCTCDSGCGNRVIQNGPLNCLVVREVGGKGLGLFTSKSIRKSRFICEYAGEVIGLREARRRVEANKNSTNYVLVVTEHVGDRALVTCIDPKQFGNIGRYANHSCEPNANLVPIRVEGSVPRLCLFASRDIGIGEEITFNYAGGVNSVHNPSVTRCLCGSNNCSGYLPHNSI
ncbi:probable histone-lysine N-methyltransferase set-23 [Ceratina calcarata]|uniref:Probable histone-lysine N-methyltransferase set-23 n=1 Tax=Ceratina calcarata TaxID=156304 RepID=A0AAJ7JI03_9HYME|nr:probable histone-lysine N-methyltransferase set-23 [Ceratina calcarata]